MKFGALSGGRPSLAVPGTLAGLTTDLAPACFRRIRFRRTTTDIEDAFEMISAPYLRGWREPDAVGRANGPALLVEWVHPGENKIS